VVEDLPNFVRTAMYLPVVMRVTMH